MVLWEYWPRWIVALPGQHRGKVEVMLVNFMPLLVTSLFKFGMAFSEPGIWSSVRTKMMLGLVCPSASIPTNVTPHASITPKATKANESTVRLITLYLSPSLRDSCQRLL
jgi:hypothetical protein